MTHRADFEELVRHHHADVYRTAWRLLRDDADAQDATQEVFLRLARDPAPLAGAESPAAVLRWLAVRAALAHLRGARRRRDREERYAMEHEPDQAPARPDDLAAERGDAEALERELGALAADLRVALELRYRAGLTFAAIGAATGVSEPSAHARVRKALDRLRARLARPGLAGLGGLAAADLERALATAPDVPVPPGLAPAILARTAPAWDRPGGGDGAATLPPAPGAAVASAARALLAAPLGLLTVGTVGLGLALGLALGDGERGAVGVAVASSPEAVRAGLDGGGAAAASSAEERIALSPAEADAGRPPVPGAPAVAAEREEHRLGALTGRAVDRDGRALAGVRVHAFATERTGKMPRFERVATSASDGAFALALPVAHDAGQPYRVALSHRDVVRRVVGPARVRAGETAALGDVALERNSADRPGEVAVALLVVGADDAPLAGAEVALVRRVAAQHPWAEEVLEDAGRTDDNGRVTLASDRLGAKLLRVDARGATPAAGIATASLAVATSGRVDETVRVGPGAAIAGRVLTVDGGVPRGFGLWAARPRADGGGRWTDRVQAEIAPDGAFRVAGLAPGRYDLWGAGDGWSTLRLDAVEAGRADLALFVKRADDPRDLGDHLAELHGRAVAAETGAPLPIEWLDVEAERLPDGLDPGALRADAIPNALLHSVAQVMVPSGGVPAPAPELHVAGLEPGRYVLTVFADDRAVGVLGPLELGPGEVLRDLVVPVPRGAAVSGVVRDPAGRPLADAWLVVTGDGPLSRARVDAIATEVREDDGRQRYYLGARARTGGDGRFRLEHLPPGLPLSLAAVHAEHDPGWSPVLVLADGEDRRGVTLALERR